MDSMDVPAHMSSQPVRVLFLIYLLAAALHSEPLPAIPASSRILTIEQVANFWVNTLSRKPVPSKPSGLHPERQAAWQRAFDDRRATILSVTHGYREGEARLAMLAHNSAAWRRQGNEQAALAADAELRRWAKHLSVMDTLAVWRQVGQTQIELNQSRSSWHH